jgi:hypothetical protein
MAVAIIIEVDNGQPLIRRVGDIVLNLRSYHRVFDMPVENLQVRDLIYVDSEKTARVTAIHKIEISFQKTTVTFPRVKVY